MPLTHPRHAIRIAFSVDRERDSTGVGAVVHAKVRAKRGGQIVVEASERLGTVADPAATACLFALELARCGGFRRLEIGVTGSFVRVLQRSQRTGNRTGRVSVDAILDLSEHFDVVHFRWLSRRRTVRARQLAARASGVAARRQERRRTAQVEELFELNWLAEHEDIDLETEPW